MKRDPFTDSTFHYAPSPATMRILELTEARKKLGFAITWAQNNLRWMLGDDKPNRKKINKTRKTIWKLEQKLQAIPNPFAA
jgi:hypothetical protein